MPIRLISRMTEGFDVGAVEIAEEQVERTLLVRGPDLAEELLAEQRAVAVDEGAVGWEARVEVVVVDAVVVGERHQVVAEVGQRQVEVGVPEPRLGKAPVVRTVGGA
jgi:hypothetical protein